MEHTNNLPVANPWHPSILWQDFLHLTPVMAVSKQRSLMPQPQPGIMLRQHSVVYRTRVIAV